MTPENNNAVLIVDLRETAAYLEANPQFPKLTIAVLASYLSEREQLIEAAGHMGSFKKTYDDYNFALRKSFGCVDVTVNIPRDQVCQKIITWNCPDDSALLREFAETAEQL